MSNTSDLVIPKKYIEHLRRQLDETIVEGRSQNCWQNLSASQATTTTTTTTTTTSTTTSTTTTTTTTSTSTTTNNNDTNTIT